MRLDKYLKVSRIIKRRTVAKETIDSNLVLLNGKTAKACSEVNVGDQLTISNNGTVSNYKILKILEYATEANAKTMYEKVEK